MNCEKYQELLSDLVDGSASAANRTRVEAHLSGCVVCAEVRDDLAAILGFCREQRGEYDAVPNERALWLRISNMIEAENLQTGRPNIPRGASWWFRLMNRKWQLSFPQIAGAVAAIVLMVSVVASVGVRSLPLLSGSGFQSAGLGFSENHLAVEDRYRQQQQTIAYWNQRVEINKARWNSQMRDTFDRNMGVIDAAVNDSMSQLRSNPHDEISEEILNDALNDKINLLREFAEL